MFRRNLLDQSLRRRSLKERLKRKTSGSSTALCPHPLTRVSWPHATSATSGRSRVTSHESRSAAAASRFRLCWPKLSRAAPPWRRVFQLADPLFSLEKGSVAAGQTAGLLPVPTLLPAGPLEAHFRAARQPIFLDSSPRTGFINRRGKADGTQKLTQTNLFPESGRPGHHGPADPSAVGG